MIKEIEERKREKVKVKIKRKGEGKGEGEGKGRSIWKKKGKRNCAKVLDEGEE